MRIGFLMDPLEDVRVDRGPRAAAGWLHVADGRTHARMWTVKGQRKAGSHFRVAGDSPAALAGLDVLFLRKDPPVDREFLGLGEIDALSGESLEAKMIDFAVDRTGLRARAAAGM